MSGSALLLSRLEDVSQFVPAETLGQTRTVTGWLDPEARLPGTPRW